MPSSARSLPSSLDPPIHLPDDLPDIGIEVSSHAPLIMGETDIQLHAEPLR